MTTGRLFIDYSIRKLRQYEERIGECLSRLSEEQVWDRTNEESNAVGNLVLHLSGNVRQWIGSGVAGRADERKRDAEFAARGEVGIAELREKLRQVIAEATGDLEGLGESELLEKMTVQSYTLTKLEGIYHVVEHFSGHANQIALLTKAYTNRALGFYTFIGTQGHGEKTP